MEEETVFSFVISRLLDLLVEEGEHLKALCDPVANLQQKLSEVEELLEFAYIRRDNRTIEIIDLADQLTNSIEKYVVKLSSKNIGIRKRSLGLEILSAIDKITTKITDLVISQSGVANDVSTSRPPRMFDHALDSLVFKKEDFIGRENDINELVSYLVDQENEQFQVLSIFAIGGMGKSALAIKLYEDKRVLSHFTGFAFVVVSKRFEGKEIFKQILQQLVPERSEEIMSDMSYECVLECLQREQREKKCLIILDDLWKVVDWESLIPGLTNAHMGSKILLTTRIKDVAARGLCYRLNSLNDEESWELFRQKVFPNPDSEIDQTREDLGRKIIASCRGIPLALLVLGGVLLTKPTINEWGRFYVERSKAGNQDLNKQVVDELLFGYKELPYQLKPCFLYMATFSEAEEIDAERLYMLWDAQGMIRSKDREQEETMMDVAELYLGELAKRSMVQVKLRKEVVPGVRRRFLSCRLHGQRREICLLLGVKENFNGYVSHGPSTDKPLKLDFSDVKTFACNALYFSGKQEYHIPDKHEVIPQVRSLTLVNGTARKISNLKKLKFLRVLGIDNSIYHGKEDISTQLIHLRYLSLHGCKVKKLPISKANWRYLQSLNLQEITPEEPISDDFLKNLKRLRHLILPFVGDYEVTPKNSRLRLDGLMELETLINLDSRKCMVKDVYESVNLRRLDGKIQISSDEEAEELKGFMNKVSLDQSRNSSLAIVLDNPTIEIYSSVLKGEFPGLGGVVANEIEIIWIRGKLLSQFSNFSKLTHLTLKEFELVEDPMPILESIMTLQNLALLDGKLQGREMLCSREGFPQLRVLSIERVDNWEKWSVEQGAMPNIFRLRIEYCTKLEMLPDELKFMSTLRYLEIRDMPDKFTRRVRGRVNGEKEGQDYSKIQHVRTVVIYFF